VKLSDQLEYGMIWRFARCGYHACISKSIVVVFTNHLVYLNKALLEDADELCYRVGSKIESFTLKSIKFCGLSACNCINTPNK